MFSQALTSVVPTEDGGVLQWDSEGYYLVGENDWKDIEIEATFTYKGGSIGIIPRFQSEYTYLYFRAGQVLYVTDEELGLSEEKNMITFQLFINDEEIELGQKILEAPLVEGQVYVLKAVVTRYNYKLYLDNQLQLNIDYAGILRGSAAIYATGKNQCSSVSIFSNFPNKWVSNSDQINNATAYPTTSGDEETGMRLENPEGSLSDLYIEQEITLPEKKDISFYANYLGECTMSIEFLDGLQAGMKKTVIGKNVTKWSLLEGKTIAPADCTKVKIRFAVAPNQSASIKDVQVEPEKITTSYIQNKSTTEVASRPSSLLTFPSKEIIDNRNGTISFWMKPNSDYDATLNKRYMLFQYGDPINGITICGIENEIFVQHGSTSASFDALPIQKNEWYHIAMTWNEQNLGISVNGTIQYKKVIDLFHEEAETINIGFDMYSDYETFNGTIDDLTIYKRALDEYQIEEVYSSDVSIDESGDVTFHATFNHAIGNFQKTYIEIPNAPEYGSPIIARKEDGSVLRKVSFLDYDTGLYQTWNEEIVDYYGEDFIAVSFDDLDVENYKISVLDSKGSIVGEPYRVDGKNIYLTFTAEEKKKYKATELRARYQLNDSYTVDYNIEAADSFRVDIAKHDGQKIKVVYEGNRFSEEKLADMIEMNPLLNPNHQGFLYLTQETGVITSFKVKITPPDLPADGVSESLIIIEPVDANGNHVCNANLTIRATHGTIHPSLGMEAVRLRQIAGRYIYNYVAPLKYRDLEVKEILDAIKIIDTDTGIGVEKYITLCLYDKYEIIAPDVKDKNTVSPELMGAFLLEELIKVIGTPVHTLPIVMQQLNFTKSGTVNIKDVTWIKEKLYTTDLQKAYQEILRYTQER